MFPRYYNLVLGLRPFSAEVSPIATRLIGSQLRYPVSEKIVKDARLAFLQWMVGRLMFEQFLVVVRNHRDDERYEQLYQLLREEVPTFEQTFSQCIRSVLRMHQLPDSVHLLYDGYDAFLLRGRDGA